MVAKPMVVFGCLYKNKMCSAAKRKREMETTNLWWEEEKEEEDDIEKEEKRWWQEKTSSTFTNIHKQNLQEEDSKGMKEIGNLLKKQWRQWMWIWSCGRRILKLCSTRSWWNKTEEAAYC